MNKTHHFSVPDMTCGHCRMRISAALGNHPGILEHSVDLESKTVTVTSELETAAIAGAIDKAGYEALLLD